MNPPTEHERLKWLVAEFAFWARRYCDGRASYCTRVYNDLVREGLRLGIQFTADPADEETIWARDRMGPAFSGEPTEAGAYQTRD